MKRFLPYNPKLKERARELRKNMTEPEKKLWYNFLRDISQKTPPQSPSIEGEANSGNWVSRGSLRTRIYRQRPIENFIVDFYIPEYKLVIEIDGDSHYEDGAQEHDEERTDVLEWLWLEVLRFTNKEVMNEFDWVCDEISIKLSLNN